MPLAYQSNNRYEREVYCQNCHIYSIRVDDGPKCHNCGAYLIRVTYNPDTGERVTGAHIDVDGSSVGTTGET